MNRRAVVENRRDRKALAADAGYGKISVTSIFAGVLVAYGAFAVLAGLVGAILEAFDFDTDLAGSWDELGLGGGLVVAALLFLSYLFGGYVAGRMARRAGMVHGAGVFLLGILVVVAVAAIVTQATDTDAILGRLRDLGVPTTSGEWGEIGTVAGLASLAAMLLGSLLGGMLGERWHAKLLARAVDPDVGTEARARRQAAEAAALAGERRTESTRRVEAANPTLAGRKAGTIDGGGTNDENRTVDPGPDRTPQPDVSYSSGSTRSVDGGHEAGGRTRNGA